MSANNYFLIEAGQKKQADLIYDSEPGAESLLLSRSLVPGFTGVNEIIYLNLLTGNDANSGFTEPLAKLTYAAALAAAGGIRKIRIISANAAISVNVSQPTEMKPGLLGTIGSFAITPINTWTDVSTAMGNVNNSGMVWAGRAQRFYGVSASGAPTTKGAFSADGVTWTASAVHPSLPNARLAYSFFLNRCVGVSASGSQISYTDDGSTWVVSSVAGIVGEFPADIVYSEIFNVFLLLSTVGGIFSSADGVTWARVMTIGNGFTFARICEADIFRAIYISTTTGEIFKTENFVTLTQCTGATAADAILFYAGGVLIANGAARSVDGLDFVAATTPTTILPATSPGVTFDTSLGRFILAGGSVVQHSSDGDTWATVATPGTITNARCAAYSPTLGRSVIGGGLLSKAIISAVRPITISAPVAGFTVGAVNYTGAVALYAVTTGAVAGLSTLTATAVKILYGNLINYTTGLLLSRSLIRGGVYGVGTYIANGCNIDLNTVRGRVTLRNASQTNLEKIRSNIIENGIRANFSVTVSSGNTRGANLNAVFNSFCSFSDPKVVDLVSYKLQYESQGFSANSPMVQHSPDFFNSQGQRRDLGAWSAYEANIRFIYARAFMFLKPAEKNAVQHIKHNRADLHVSIDGTPDVATDPAGRWEELVLNYRSLPNTDFSDAVRNHIAFVDYLESLENPACRITFDPAFTPAASVTVNGAQPAGTVVLNLLPSALESGNRLDIAGVEYMVLYMAGNSAVLSKPLAVGIADAVSIPVSSQIGYGVFQYVAPPDRRLTRWYEGATDFFNGLVMRFVRKWV
jgi:hypothetical protein